MNSISAENCPYSSNSPKKGLIEGANCAGSVANTKTLDTACVVSLCMIPCVNEFHTLKHV